MEVDILGITAHVSKPGEGEDAILHSGWFLRVLEQYQRHLPVDETLGQASLHCGLIRGGEEPSSYPGKCTITVESRTIPCQTEEPILGDVNVLLSDIPKVEFSFPVRGASNYALSSNTETGHGPSSRQKISRLCVYYLKN